MNEMRTMDMTVGLRRIGSIGFKGSRLVLAM